MQSDFTIDSSSPEDFISPETVWRFVNIQGIQSPVSDTASNENTTKTPLYKQSENNPS
jgi:hypothetical protein